MTYVMSDLHGEYRLFVALMKKRKDAPLRSILTTTILGVSISVIVL